MKRPESFKSYIKEDRGVVLFWGRCNPPTIGHELVFNKAAQIANNNSWPLRIYFTHTKDNKKNPLFYDDKIAFAKELFPRYKKYIKTSKERSITAVLKTLQDSYSSVILVTGDDRTEYFQTIFDKYNGKDYYFKNIKAISSGKRDPESESVEGISSTKMRHLAGASNYKEFIKGLPNNTKPELANRIYFAIQKGLGINKIVDKATDKTRELFYSKELASVGQTVEVKKVGKAVVKKLGANYIVLEHNGQLIKCWPDDIITDLVV